MREPSDESAPAVFIIDDDASARHSIATLVKTVGHPAQEFSSGEEFLQRVSHALRGCIVADVRMPGISGLDLQDRLIETGIEMPIILITAFADIPLAVRAMERGALTLLEKSPREQDLLDAIRKGLERDSTLHRFRAEREEILVRMATLTPEERKVMEMIVAGKSNKAISLELDIGLRTVETRRHFVMAKLKAESVPELVKLVLTVRPNGQSPLARRNA